MSELTFNEEKFQEMMDRLCDAVPDDVSSIEELSMYYDIFKKGYQYAVDKAFDVLSQMLYTKRDDEHPAQHYTRSVESMGKFVSQTDFLNQFKQFMEE